MLRCRKESFCEALRFFKPGWPVAVGLARMVLRCQRVHLASHRTHALKQVWVPTPGISVTAGSFLESCRCKVTLGRLQRLK